MPPRRSARVAALTEPCATALAPLPLPIVLHIFSLLPVDTRLRCAEVCRGWRNVLLERSLWTRLDLSATSVVRVPLRWPNPLDALLRCAAARAGGSLQSLRIENGHVTHAALLEVAAANAGALRELQVCNEQHNLGLEPDEAEALLRAAPLLELLATDLSCDYTGVQAASRALRNEAPFGPLRVRDLVAYLLFTNAAGVVALAADVAAHASLVGLTLQHTRLDTPAALDAVVDAALARRMQYVKLYHCRLSPASAPALARLLSSDALTTLECRSRPQRDAPVAGVLAAALRANSTLTSLALDTAGVFDDAAAGAELLGALTGHASLRVLDLQRNHVMPAEGTAVGAALGALLAANTPALTELDVSECNLGDDGLRPLFAALRANTQLRTLTCANNYHTLHMPHAFARDVLLPAVRANTGLRMLDTGNDTAIERKAAALVARRSS
jgi:hypothetical protein